MLMWYTDRVEKEKNALKAEVEELQAQIQHISKNKVTVTLHDLTHVVQC